METLQNNAWKRLPTRMTTIITFASRYNVPDNHNNNLMSNKEYL